ncbi:MAG: phosphoadenylyl-sulfate reductase [Candidatus Azobacteroides pseudotrichonymphae]|jgi:phosphoadenosine phosphosulfate reductase|nr:MAG: phosphoadenylyl-sulfate reductase [Candidatus Azobacteroides pseudotrichonymphae]
MHEDIDLLNSCFVDKSPEDLLTFFLKKYKGRIGLASSLGLEDQVLTDMILKIDSETTIFSIDTGRLFPETYLLIDNINSVYNIKLDIYMPKSEDVEAYIKKNGVNGFYESLDKRKECCRIRKIEPLLRALSALDVWICGLRREQSVTRSNIRIVEWDEVNKLIKVNPLVNWKEQEIWSYIEINQVPYNVLQKRGFPSVGCQPCTRAIKKGEDIRAGRWWWESSEHKECGLHKR